MTRSEFAVDSSNQQRSIADGSRNQSKSEILALFVSMRGISVGRDRQKPVREE
jgi:hypothetical protein